MAYAFVQDVPIDEKMYGEIKAKFGADTPQGLIAHIVLKQKDGLRYIDTWETQADWERFRDEVVHPAVSEVLAGYGLPMDQSLVKFETADAVDTWVGGRQLV